MTVLREPEQVEVAIVRTLDVASLNHLDEQVASSEEGIGLNLAYFDARAGTHPMRMP
jgi:hypothetical protein